MRRQDVDHALVAVLTRLARQDADATDAKSAAKAGKADHPQPDSSINRWTTGTVLSWFATVAGLDRYSNDYDAFAAWQMTGKGLYGLLLLEIDEIMTILKEEIKVSTSARLAIRAAVVEGRFSVDCVEGTL